MDDNLCPICGGISDDKYFLPADFIKQKLSKHFANTIPDNVIITDYRMMRCNECSFEFASPKMEGTSSFYQWVTTQDNYYPENRWEYGKVIELINQSDKKVTVLDVGCGDGRFFDEVKNVTRNISCTGIDLTPESVAKCVDKGHNAECLDIEKFKEKYPRVLFDVVVSFHCLEHISTPLAFLKDMKSLLNDDGCIYVSTPYSPMTIEIDWFDVLNHPPHHMGRWNKKSYEAIAAIADLKLEFYAPPASSALIAALSSFMFSETGEVHYTLEGMKRLLLKKIFTKPFKFLRHITLQLKREKLFGKPAPNVVLVKFTKNNT